MAEVVRIALCLAAFLIVASCSRPPADNAEAVPAAESTSVPAVAPAAVIPAELQAQIRPLAIDRSQANWRVESDGQVYAGRLFKYFTLKDQLTIQLVNMDAVNIALTFDGDMTSEKAVASAMFVEGRGDPCRRVGPPESFRIRFEPAEKGWVTGHFSGMLGCPDYRAMAIVGSFHIPAPGASR